MTNFTYTDKPIGKSEIVKCFSGYMRNFEYSNLRRRFERGESGFWNRLLFVEYRQEHHVTKNYKRDLNIACIHVPEKGQELEWDIKNHFGRILKVTLNKEGIPYMTLVDYTRVRIKEGKPLPRRVNLTTVSWLKVNGVYLIANGKLITNARIDRAGIFLYAHKLRSDLKFSFSEALKKSWANYKNSL